MQNLASTLIGAVVMFGAVTAGTYTGRVIPAHDETTPAGVTAPATTNDTKPADQPVNEQNGQLMPGLTAADYFAAGQACDAYGSLGMGTSTDKQKAAKELKNSMYMAAVKAVGVDPETCKKF